MNVLLPSTRPVGIARTVASTFVYAIGALGCGTWAVYSVYVMAFSENASGPGRLALLASAFIAAYLIKWNLSWTAEAIERYATDHAPRIRAAQIKNGIEWDAT